MLLLSLAHSTNRSKLLAGYNLILDSVVALSPYFGFKIDVDELVALGPFAIGVSVKHNFVASGISDFGSGVRDFAVGGPLDFITG